MAQAIALAELPRAAPALAEIARTIIVAACALALIAAGPALPFG